MSTTSITAQPNLVPPQSIVPTNWAAIQGEFQQMAYWMGVFRYATSNQDMGLAQSALAQINSFLSQMTDSAGNAGESLLSVLQGMGSIIASMGSDLQNGNWTAATSDCNNLQTYMLNNLEPMIQNNL